MDILARIYVEGLPVNLSYPLSTVLIKLPWPPFPKYCIGNNGIEGCGISKSKNS